MPNSRSSGLGMTFLVGGILLAAALLLGSSCCSRPKRESSDADVAVALVDLQRCLDPSFNPWIAEGELLKEKLLSRLPSDTITRVAARENLEFQLAALPDPTSTLFEEKTEALGRARRLLKNDEAWMSFIEAYRASITSAVEQVKAASLFLSTERGFKVVYLNYPSLDEATARPKYERSELSPLNHQHKKVTDLTGEVIRAIIRSK